MGRGAVGRPAYGVCPVFHFPWGGDAGPPASSRAGWIPGGRRSRVPAGGEVMKKLTPIVMVAITVLLVAAGTVHGNRLSAPSTPEAAVQQLFDHVRSRDFGGAYTYIAKSSNIDAGAFYRDVNGANSSLRTYSSLQKVETKVLHEDDSQAVVRATAQWSSAVGAVYDTRDLPVVKEEGAWRVAWPVEKLPNLPPQVIPVNYLRWDIIHRG